MKFCTILTLKYYVCSFCNLCLFCVCVCLFCLHTIYFSNYFYSLGGFSINLIQILGFYFILFTLSAHEIRGRQGVPIYLIFGKLHKTFHSILLLTYILQFLIATDFILAYFILFLLTAISAKLSEAERGLQTTGILEASLWGLWPVMDCDRVKRS